MRLFTWYYIYTLLRFPSPMEHAVEPITGIAFPDTIAINKRTTFSLTNVVGVRMEPVVHAVGQYGSEGKDRATMLITHAPLESEEMSRSLIMPLKSKCTDIGTDLDTDLGTFKECRSKIKEFEQQLLFGLSGLPDVAPQGTKFVFTISEGGNKLGININDQDIGKPIKSKLLATAFANSYSDPSLFFKMEPISDETDHVQGLRWYFVFTLVYIWYNSIAILQIPMVIDILFVALPLIPFTLLLIRLLPRGHSGRRERGARRDENIANDKEVENLLKSVLDDGSVNLDGDLHGNNGNNNNIFGSYNLHKEKKKKLIKLFMEVEELEGKATKNGSESGKVFSAATYGKVQRMLLDELFKEGKKEEDEVPMDGQYKDIVISMLKAAEKSAKEEKQFRN